MTNLFIKHPWLVLASIGTAAILLLAFGLTMMVKQNASFIKNCQAAGGHNYRKGDNWLCLDGEGKVIEVTP